MNKYIALLISALLAGIVVQWFMLSRLRSENPIQRIGQRLDVSECGPTERQRNPRGPGVGIGNGLAAPAGCRAIRTASATPR
jgi:hypothetical protein